MAEAQNKINTPERSGFPGRRPLGRGCRIGEYSIVRILSENAEGFVYLAQDSILGDMVQIKEFFPEEMAVRAEREQGEELSASEPSGPDVLHPQEGCAAKFKYFRACFQDLYSTLRQERDNECLLPILQIVEQNATVYVVSEYRALQTLEQHLQQVGGRESWCRAKQYLLPLYNSLANLHKAGIIHQCISPDNILLDEQGNPFWKDFFLSEMRTEESQQLASGYAAPEQYQQGGWSGVWTDVYSIAAVTYRVLTGITPPDALRRQQRDTLCPASQLDENIEPNLSQALWDAMKLSSSERCDSVSALTARMLDSADSNTMVFQVESDVTEQTVHLDSLQGQFAHKLQNQGAAALEQKEQPSRAKMGGIYLVITMAATLLVLAVGMPQLIKWAGSNWDSFWSGDSLGEEPADSNNVIQLQENSPEQTVQTHTVDSFVGRRAQTVLSNSDYEKWYSFQTEEVYDEEFAEGFIVDQSLDPGEEITRRTSVTLYVSKGSEMEPMPNLIGKTAEEAVAQLTGMNKRYQLVEGSSDAVEPGEVFRTDPAAGTELKKDENDLVLLYVAQEQAQSGDEQTEEDDGVQILSQKNSDRKVIRKKDTATDSTDTATDSKE